MDIWKAAQAEWKTARCSKDRIRIYGFAFHGKKVLINGGPIQELLVESGE